MARWLIAAAVAHIGVLLALVLLAPAPQRARATPDEAARPIEVALLAATPEPSQPPEPEPTAPSSLAASATPSAAPAPSASQAPPRQPPAVPQPPAATQSAPVAVHTSPNGNPADVRVGAEPSRRARTLDGSPPPEGIQLFPSQIDALAMVQEGQGPLGPRAAPSRFQHNLEREHLARTARSGMGPSGAVASAARVAAREFAPREGEARLLTVIDSKGNVTEVRVLNGRGADWKRIAAAIKRALAKRALHVSGATRGVQVITKIAVAYRLPSGSRSAVGFEGGTGTFDMADIGAIARRVVSVSTEAVTPL